VDITQRMHDTLFMNFETLKEITGNPNLNPADWHQHKNGGGWVYKDVFIEENPEIYIGPKAIVWGGTIRKSNFAFKCEMHGGVMWGGVMWGGEMLEGTWETTPLFIAGSKHSLSNAKPGYIQIGCQLHTFAHWQKHVRGIAKIHGYNKAEQDEYAAYVELFIKLGK